MCYTERMRPSLLALLLAAPSCVGFLTADAQKTLLATPETVVWGNYNGAAKPVLTVASGETVTLN